MSVGVGLYGANGHQIQRALLDNPRARLVAVAAMPEPPDGTGGAPAGREPGVPAYPDLDALLADDRVDLVSLCSPRRADQAMDAVRCLAAGKHVYAEKPCALTEADLDAVEAAARRSAGRFHEMAGTAFEQPYLAMREVVRAGTIGTVVQVLAQKSYPYHDRRPDDDETDGGLLRQVGVHALRFVAHVAGERILDVAAVETGLGNPRGGGGLRMAAALTMTLAGGGVAAAVLNYLNPPGFGGWGNETLRIFGSDGFVEAVDAGARTRLVVGDVDHGPLRPDGPGRDYFEMFLDELYGVAKMPLTLAEELHPTRLVIRAKAQLAPTGGVPNLATCQ